MYSLVILNKFTPPSNIQLKTRMKRNFFPNFDAIINNWIFRSIVFRYTSLFFRMKKSVLIFICHWKRTLFSPSFGYDDSHKCSICSYIENCFSLWRAKKTHILLNCTPTNILTYTVMPWVHTDKPNDKQ